MGVSGTPTEPSTRGHGVTSPANVAAGATRGFLSMWNVAIAQRDAISLLSHFNEFKFE